MVFQRLLKIYQSNARRVSEAMAEFYPFLLNEARRAR
jgi:hypothetical protein